LQRSCSSSADSSSGGSGSSFGELCAAAAVCCGQHEVSLLAAHARLCCEWWLAAVEVLQPLQVLAHALLHVAACFGEGVLEDSLGTDTVEETAAAAAATACQMQIEVKQMPQQFD
jgi:hypothetical protein